jgi:hypothetical protein
VPRFPLFRDLSPYPGRVYAPHNANMTQTPETTEPPTAPAQSPSTDRSDRPSRVDHLWALVGITAGVVFTVAVIFFSGFYLGRATEGPYGMHRVSDGTCPMMGSGAGMSPGGSMGPGHAATPTPQSTPHP